MYFRYRGATKGAEQFCYGILDADNVKRRRFYEVQSFFADISKYEKEMSAPVKNDVAIVYDYDSLASFRIQRQSILLDTQAEMQKIYKAFYDVNVGVDVIPADRDLSSYKVVILPQLIITKPEMEKKIKVFAENGGTVVFTYRCAVKDEDNNVPFGKTMPVNYNELTGISVVETESLQEYAAFPIVGKGSFEGKTGMGGIFRDMIAVDDAEVLYGYDDDFYREFAAVTRRKSGKGTVYYIGCGVDASTNSLLMKTIMKDNGIEMLGSPEGVEVVARGTEDSHVKMYINHNAYRTETDGIELAPFEVKIIK
jgi:beta-galactosidase